MYTHCSNGPQQLPSKWTSKITASGNWISLSEEYNNYCFRKAVVVQSFFLIIGMLVAEEPLWTKVSDLESAVVVFCYILQEKAQHLQRNLAAQVDKSTQTELVGHDVSCCIKQFFLLSFLLMCKYLPTSLSWLLLSLYVDTKVCCHPSFCCQMSSVINIATCQHTAILLIACFINSSLIISRICIRTNMENIY